MFFLELWTSLLSLLALAHCLRFPLEGLRVNTFLLDLFWFVILTVIDSNTDMLLLRINRITYLSDCFGLVLGSWLGCWENVLHVHCWLMVNESQGVEMIIVNLDVECLALLQSVITWHVIIVHYMSHLVPDLLCNNVAVMALFGLDRNLIIAVIANKWRGLRWLLYNYRLLVFIFLFGLFCLSKSFLNRGGDSLWKVSFRWNVLLVRSVVELH